MESMKQEPKLKNNFLKLIILTLSGSIIYSLPYFRMYYYDTYLEIFNLTNTQIGTFGSIYGLFGMISYLFGGVLADRVSSKKLVSFSLILTGIGGFIHLIRPPYMVLLGVYAMWGVTSLLTFWPALVKAIRMLGNSDEQGKVFGLFEGGRGVVNAVHLAAALAVFGYFSKSINDGAGINGIIIFYSSITILLGFVNLFILKEDPSEVSDKFDFSNIKTVLKMKSVWLIIIILCCSYTMNMSFYYITPYATSVLGASAVLGATLTMLAQYLRPFASSGAGFLADKLGLSNILMLGFLFMGGGLIAILFIPSSATNAVMILGICCVFIYAAMYMNYGIIFALLEEGNIPLQISGTAIGIISTLGYIPEFLCPLIAGRMFDIFPGATGYRIYFVGLVIFMIIGFITTIIWKKYINTLNSNK